MARGSKRSGVVDALLTTAQDDLWLQFQRAQLAKHPVLRGSAREEAVRILLSKRLPQRYRTVSGEVVDRNDRYSRQTDAIVFDAVENPVFRIAPNNASAGTRAESSSLRPFGGKFVGARQKGRKVAVETYRCFVTLFAYRSDLAANSSWLSREWTRYLACLGPGYDADLIDRIVVLDRGIISPPFATGKAAADKKPILHEWFVGFANFLDREGSRRAPMDWQIYVDRYSTGWSKLS